MGKPPKDSLTLTFHGRIIDHLGIQMYQSPVAAIAELVANAWDADATEVRIRLPDHVGEDAGFDITDNGVGMTFEECELRYLNVGYDRRSGNPDARTEKGRPVLGRKGIGKFAGFGIAKVVEIETVSGENGERTKFELDVEKLRSPEEYVGGPLKIEVREYDPPDASRRKLHGTTVRLKRLAIKRSPSPRSFARSMSRRFLLHKRVDDFNVFVNGEPIPTDDGLEDVQFRFPTDYREEEKPEGLIVDENGWGEEVLPDGHKIRWQIVFNSKPIDEEELRGVAVFVRGKLAQRPFMFNIAGGISGQNALEYLSGRVEADYLDSEQEDVIATERQRINWELDLTLPLLQWGRDRIKKLARIWKERRAEEKMKMIEDKTERFAERLSKFRRSERRTILAALKKLASIDALDDERFKESAEALILAWERGRLRDLIDDLANVPDLNEENLIDILIEADVLTALHMAEVVKSRLETVRGLEERIEKKELENAVRDYIAENPWILSPRWETFAKETSVKRWLDPIKEQYEVDVAIPEDIRRKRIDLILGGGDSLVVVEFMRPGLTVNGDHLHRFTDYIYAVRAYVEANTGLRYKRVTGMLVADRLEENPVIARQLADLERSDMYAVTWKSLLAAAESSWKDFLFALKERTHKDPRLDELAVEPGKER